MPTAWFTIVVKVKVTPDYHIISLLISDRLLKGSKPIHMVYLEYNVLKYVCNLPHLSFHYQLSIIVFNFINDFLNCYLCFNYKSISDSVNQYISPITPQVVSLFHPSRTSATLYIVVCPTAEHISTYTGHIWFIFTLQGFHMYDDLSEQFYFVICWQSTEKTWWHAAIKHHDIRRKSVITIHLNIWQLDI